MRLFRSWGLGVIGVIQRPKSVTTKDTKVHEGIRFSSGMG